MTDNPADHNATVWADGRYIAHYDHDQLTPVETVVLVRYRDAILGRVLDVGCGAGRLLRYLDLLGGEVHAVDLSPVMVEHCRRRFPDSDIHRGDLRDLAATETGPYDAIIISDNTLDVVDDQERRAVLATIRSLLAPTGLLMFESHNLDCWDRQGGATRESPVREAVLYARDVLRARDGSRLQTALGPAYGWANRRRLGPMQHRGADYAILNDRGHRSSLLHYTIGSAAQRRQLRELGYEVLEVLERDGSAVPDAGPGQSAHLYYIARPAAEGTGAA